MTTRAAPPVLSSTLVSGEPAGTRVMYVLHGIFGRGRNWGAIARHLQVRRPDWQSVLIDLRLHGDSQSFPPPHTIDACASDVARLESRSGHEPRAVLGHSFGGKVALMYAARAGLPMQVWIMDSTPAARSTSGSAWALLQLARSLPKEYDSRFDAIHAMQQRGAPAVVASWMSTNLQLDPDGRYRWRLDLGGVGTLLEDFYRVDLWSVVEEPPAALDLHFVKARESNLLDEAACQRIRKAGARHGRAHLHVVPGGHWINTDNPEGILDLLSAHLPRS